MAIELQQDLPLTMRECHRRIRQLERERDKITKELQSYVDARMRFLIALQLLIKESKPK